ncbi:MAG: deoxyribose-phosphate aldolase [Candidatus Atribacteria bacterium]|nr:deoxyribose-phosphate aldolase [Candidatus Atribacteria bacterium]
MNREELIERITREVLSKLRNVPLAGSEGPSEDKFKLTPADLPPYIDHTLLKPDACVSMVEKLCEEAIQYRFYSVCVNPYWVSFCARKLRGTGVKVCTVVGFPLGANDSRTKAFETRNAIENGADEIDMVINIGALKSRDLKTVEEDLWAVKRACRPTTVTKAIIETCLLSDEEKVLVSELIKKVGFDFVKTSTGFSTGGATAHDVALIRKTVGPKMGIKASGGIRTFEDARLMILSGATRLGTSSSVKIVSG